MKATGIVRKIDNLGRIVLPKELRETMNLDIKSPMEIYVEEDKVILKKYEPACIFCGNTDSTIEYMGKTVCTDCLKKMNLKEPA
ncbi:MAG: AbrB family transcriptional regulator, transcriptional pleiotropic regulator of transition state [Halanaerobiales bacterium]|nr:AbrB family transcriptional regulator, transcriptional pleiotropic regulator of transition state [Halanaerobiales bacterium]